MLRGIEILVRDVVPGDIVNEVAAQVLEAGGGGFRGPSRASGCFYFWLLF